MSAAGLDIQVLRPGGLVERLTIQDPRVLVGTGAHCDIRIEGVGAAREHVAVEVAGDELHVRGLSFTPPALAGGTPIVDSKLPSGSEIAVCGTRILVTIAQEAKDAKKRSATALFRAGLLGAFAVAAVVISQIRPSADASVGPPPPPAALWDSADVSCRVKDPAQAMVLARRSFSIAQAKRERHPFAVEDGVGAVGAYDVAAACYRTAGAAEEARAAEGAAAALRGTIEKDYFAHRVRLDHAIEVGDGRGVMTEIRLLRRMTAARKGPYAEWLALVERRMESEAAAAAAAASAKKF